MDATNLPSPLQQTSGGANTYLGAVAGLKHPLLMLDISTNQLIYENSMYRRQLGVLIYVDTEYKMYKKILK